MRLLLDTHTLIWWLIDDGSLSRTAYNAISDPASVIFVSAASAWEIATKQRIGKLPKIGRLAGRIGPVLVQEKFAELPISLAHGDHAGRLVGEHRDPFDRMLIAQAILENLQLVSNERLFDAFGVTRLW